MAHAKQDGPGNVILKQVDAKRIQLAFAGKEMERIDTSVGGKQFVLTASR